MNTQPTLIPRDELENYFASEDEVAQFISKPTALAGIDPEVGFTSKPKKGRLATLLGHEVMVPTNEVAKLPIWCVRLLTKDWHGPKWHISWVEIRTDLIGDPKYDTVPYVMTLDEFNTWTPGNMPIEQEAQRAGINYDNVGDYLSRAKFQILWPRGRHCEQGSEDADFHPSLDLKYWDGVQLKGTVVWVDSLGAFADNGGQNETQMAERLHDKGAENVVYVDLCTEYCVETSANQGKERGFGSMVLTDCVRPVNVEPDDEAKAFARLYNNGVLLANRQILLAAARKLGKIA